MDAKRRSWNVLPRTLLWLLDTENTPSRPELISFWIIAEPGVFHSEIAGPRSDLRSCFKPSITLCRTIASCGPSR